MPTLERGQIWNFARRIDGPTERSVEVMQFSDLYVTVRNCETGQVTRPQRQRFNEEGKFRPPGYFFSGRTVNSDPTKP